ncbi:hypothetical protein rsdtw13_01370 [Clostridium sp. TW13]|uniref:Uncharacterized protein n=1 Tax=Inconstantimicrobium mannanitabidum TaxID=1604901 RepID=A0ACB5R788_9CLOT|nr:hypothetical protein rsdtw13_01370 [Clostridium sp. TW13]
MMIDYIEILKFSLKRAGRIISICSFLYCGSYQLDNNMIYFKIEVLFTMKLNLGIFHMPYCKYIKKDADNI